MPRQKRYTLDELMSECASERRRSAEEQAWLDLVPVGFEFGACDGGDWAPEPEGRANTPRE